MNMNAIMNIFIRTLTLTVFHMLVVVAGKIKLRRKSKVQSILQDMYKYKSR